VIVELPGVEKKDIKLHTTKDRLTISVDASQRKYCKEAELPVKVDPKHGESSYENGVLEVTLQKTKREERKGEPTKIEWWMTPRIYCPFSQTPIFYISRDVLGYARALLAMLKAMEL
jgi:hypothetical protein